MSDRALELSLGVTSELVDAIADAVVAKLASRTLLLTACDEDELVEVDGLFAGEAAAGPAAHDGLQQQHRLRQR